MYKKLVIAIILFCCPAAAKAQVDIIDSIVREEMQQQHITGLSLGVVKNGRVIVSKGYGFANIADSIPATERTIYRLASLSKEFIAVDVMILVEQGKLHLTDHISKYIPDVPRKWRDITIRQLLNHTSGLERESPAFRWTKKQPDLMLIEAAYDDKLLFSPGSGWSYSNLGYFIIAEIIRNVTGGSFDDHMNGLLSRCGLTNTTTTSKSRDLSKTRGYKYDERSGTTSEAVDITTFRASSAVASCISDLIKWDAMIGESDILTRQDWSKMWEDIVRVKALPDGSSFCYGYGWEVILRNGHRSLSHSGSNPGFRNEYLKFIDDKTSVIVLTNADKIDPARIARKIYASLN